MSLWITLKKYIKKRSPRKRTNKMPTKTQRASFYTCLKASYTLEAAIIIPLLAMFLVMLLSFFHLLRIQYEVEEALQYAGRKAAVESSVIESEEALYLSTQMYFLYAISEEEIVDRWVKYGAWGIGLWKSEFGKEKIILRAEYVVNLPISIGGFGEIKLSNQNAFQKWARTNSKKEMQGYVYITQYGEVYHKELSCRSLNLSVKETSVEKILDMRGKAGQKYYECSRCDWEETKKERVYYTDYGTLYHKNIACSAIKRMIEKIKVEEVGPRRPCRYCYET